jgi:hypothetical protein
MSGSMKEAAVNAAVRARKAIAALAMSIVISMVLGAVLSAVLSALATTPAAAATSIGDNRHKGGYVVPCSLVGVNPVYHPDIFGNPALAKAYYGFVRGRDGTWQVQSNCHIYN